MFLSSSPMCLIALRSPRELLKAHVSRSGAPVRQGQMVGQQLMEVGSRLGGRPLSSKFTGLGHKVV